MKRNSTRQTLSMIGKGQLVQVHPFTNIAGADAVILSFEPREQQALFADLRLERPPSVPAARGYIMRTAIRHNAVAQGGKISYAVTYRRFPNKTNFNLGFTLAGYALRLPKAPRARFYRQRLRPTKKAPAMAGASDVREAARVAACNSDLTSSAEPRQPLAGRSFPLPAASSDRQAADG